MLFLFFGKRQVSINGDFVFCLVNKKYSLSHQNHFSRWKAPAQVKAASVDLMVVFFLNKK